MSSSPKILKTVTTDLDARSYDISIGTGLLAQLGSMIQPLLKGQTAIVVSDDVVAPLYLQTVEQALSAADIKCHALVVPAGESTKSFTQYQSLSEDILALGGDRADMLIALGGGVVGDLTGFVAATLRRGMTYIQVPTTLLAQVDSSVGGKTAINTRFGKNLVGAFHQPSAVIVDIDTLTTLPKRELLAGYAEVLKYSLIQQPDFFEWLEDKALLLLAGDKKVLASAIAECCAIKAKIVADDELEQGRRALLNLGHTFGHAIEAEYGYDGTVLHGEAVGIGMVLAHQLSVDMGLMPQKDVDRIVTHLKAIGLKTCLADIDPSIDIQALIAHMHKDKKMQDGRITFIVSRGLGAAFMTKDVSMDMVEKCLQKSVNVGCE